MLRYDSRVCFEIKEESRYVRDQPHPIVFSFRPVSKSMFIIFHLFFTIPHFVLVKKNSKTRYPPFRWPTSTQSPTSWNDRLVIRSTTNSWTKGFYRFLFWILPTALGTIPLPSSNSNSGMVVRAVVPTAKNERLTRFCSELRSNKKAVHAH